MASKIPPGLQMNRQKRLRDLFRFREDIREKRVSTTTLTVQRKLFYFGKRKNPKKVTKMKFDIFENRVRVDPPCRLSHCLCVGVVVDYVDTMSA